MSFSPERVSFNGRVSLSDVFKLKKARSFT